MKNKLRILLLLLGLLGTLPLSARDFEYTHEGQTLTYTVLDETAKTVETKAGSYDGDGDPGNYVTGDLIIPSIVFDGDEAYTVTQIGRGAFCCCSDLMSVSIPSSVTSVDSRSFNGCTSLYSVKFEDGDSKLSVGFSYDTYDDFYGLLADPLFRDCPLEKVYIGRDITGYKMAIDMLGSVTASPFENQPKLTDVIIGNTVTTIGTRLFWECTGLTSISISNSVTTIESNAFTGCTGLTSISIPNSVTSLNLSGLSNLSHITIPNSVTAFDLSGCTNLNSIELQDGISIIGKLSNCTALTSITIPSSVQSIVSDAFKDCTGLEKINISDLEAWCKIGFGNYSSWSDSYYSGEYSNPLIYAHHLYLNGEEIKDLVIPNTITKINSYAFAGGSGFTSVTIPSSVTSAGECAFKDCTGLEAVHISDLAKWCEIDFGGSNNLYESEENFEITSNPLFYAHHLYFNGEEVNDELAIPEQVSKIGNNAFAGLSGITSLTIPETVTSIGINAFYGCTGLESVNISNFKAWCENDFGSNYRHYYEDGDGYLIYKYNCVAVNPVEYAPKLLVNGEELPADFVIPEEIEKIGSGAFRGLTHFTSITIPETIKSVGDEAFTNCQNLQYIHIGKNAGPIFNNDFNNDTFEDCGHVHEAICPHYKWGISEYDVDRIYKYDPSTSYFRDGLVVNESTQTVEFVSDKFASVEIPADVAAIADGAFAGCDKITEINALPEVPPTIEANNFSDEVYETAVLTIPFEGMEAYYASDWSKFRHIRVADKPEDFVRYFNDGAFRFLYYPETKEAHLINGDYREMTYASIPNRIVIEAEEGGDPEFYNVVGISKGAFASCHNLTGVKFPKELKTIAENVFADCTALESIVVPETVESVGRCAFQGCSALKSAELPDGLTEVADGLFSKCGALESVNIPAQAKRIGDSAFYWCDSMTELTIPDGVTEIGRFTFSQCDGLTSVVIPEGVSEIGNYAFYGCQGLTSIVIPEGVSTIAEGTFYFCNNLTSIAIPKSVTSIEKQAFASCHKLTEVKLSNKLESIGEEAFYTCAKLASIEIPASVQTIGKYAFNLCMNDFVMTIADGAEELNMDAKALRWTNVKSVHIGRPLSEEAYSADNFGAIQELSIGNTLTEIPDGAFANCPNLKTLTLGGGLEKIGANAFAGCALTEVVIPPSVVSIGEMAFAANSDLNEIKIGHGITEIGEKAFNDCNKIANIYMTAPTPPSAQNNTFSNYGSPLWLIDENAFEAYYNCPRCWYRFEDNMFTMKPVEAVTTDNPLIEGNPGDQLQLTVNVEPADATLPQIFWTSSDPSVATVDKDGNVTFTAESAPAAAGEDDPEEEMLYDTVRSCVISAHSMYADVPVLEVTINKTIPDEDPAVAIETVDNASDAPMEIYNLRGIRVGSDLDALPHGIYIIRQGTKTTKRAL